jgi:hypothetical protein
MINFCGSQSNNAQAFKEWVVMSAILFGRSVSLLLHLACWRWIAPRPFQFSQLFLVLIDGSYRIMGDAIKVCGYNFCLLQSFYFVFCRSESWRCQQQLEQLMVASRG